MISVRIDPTLADELGLVAKEKGMSKSEYLRGLIIEKRESERALRKTSWELGSHALFDLLTLPTADLTFEVRIRMVILFSF